MRARLSRLDGLKPGLHITTRLQTTHNSFTGAGTGYSISDTVMKNHLLSFCAPRLHRHVLAISDFKLHDLRVNALINILTTIWALMVKEGVVSACTHAAPTQATPLSSIASSSTPTTSPSGSLPLLSDIEHQHLCDFKGYFHCHLHPGLLSWKAHTACN